jgi:hypothetical protein
VGHAAETELGHGCAPQSAQVDSCITCGACTMGAHNTECCGTEGPTMQTNCLYHTCNQDCVPVSQYDTGGQGRGVPATYCGCGYQDTMACTTDCTEFSDCVTDCALCPPPSSPGHPC